MVRLSLAAMKFGHLAFFTFLNQRSFPGFDTDLRARQWLWVIYLQNHYDLKYDKHPWSCEWSCGPPLSLLMMVSSNLPGLRLCGSRSTTRPQHTAPSHCLELHSRDVGLCGPRSLFCFSSTISWQSQPDIISCLGFVWVVICRCGVNQPGAGGLGDS